MKLGDYHSFPREVDLFANYGNQYYTTNIKGEVFLWIEIQGSLNGKNGIFQYIANPHPN